MKTLSNSKRGSALLTVLILTAGLMVMLASYHSLVMFNLRASHRSFHSNATMNLAESGLEEGLYALNLQRAGDASGWAGWTINGTTASKVFSNVFSVGTSTATTVSVAVSNYNLAASTSPKIKVHAVLTLPNGMPPVDKWVEVTLNAPATGTPVEPGPTHPGLVAKQTITFKGNNATVDSWNSDPGKTGAMTQGYNSTTKDDNGFVGSLDVTVDQVLIQNADILGKVATYNDTNINNNVGPNGSILSFTSAAGTKIDKSLVSTGFKAELPDVIIPTTTKPTPTLAAQTINYITLGAITNSTSLPRSGDSPAADGKYYYDSSSISLTNKVLTISSDKVVLKTGSLTIGGGSGELKVSTGATLDLYATGNVKVSGNGIANGGTTLADAQQPASFNIWGAGGSTQEIDIKGNGVLSGVVYAPNAKVFINGNGDVLGSVVANNIVMVGNAAFHYDEALGQLALGTDADTGDSALVITLWRELLAPSEKTLAL